MMEFVSTENICGQNLLGITSRGSAIIAELLRLSSNIPDIFLGPTAKGDSHRRELVEILFNYNYLHDPDEHEKIIGMNAELLDLDEELQENHSEILDRLYILFKSIWLYQADFRKYVDDVQSGFYLHHSLEEILQDMTGKQLLCEALYLYGTMLLQLEERIPGSVREKLMIANYRYGSEGSTSNIDEVCKLCRSTGYIPGDDTKRPKNYPATFFSRFAPDSDFVRLVIGCLQTDDIYHMATSFPSPDHRSTRLAQQGSILFTILYFSPDILNSHYAVMRELVDKYFNDNWVIATYMGHTVDLSVEWASYPAARTAVENTINIAFVRQLNDTNGILTKKCLDELRGYLTEGVIQQNFLLDNIKPLMKCVRSCNVALRWRLMHRRCRNQVYNKIIHESVSPHMLVTLLLNTSQLEFILKEQLLQLLANKDAAWTGGKTSASGRLSELAEYFTGEKALTRVKRDEKLMNWFTGLAAQVRSLDLEEDHATSTGRRIQGLIAALEDVEQFESIDVNVQTKSFLSEIRDVLRQMIRTVNVKDELLDHIENISDFSYAWEALTDYLDVFHERIRSDSSSVVLLRATFLKAASVLDVPLIRISTIESPDAVSVAEYYSSELVEFVRLVLGIIPVTVFKIMGEIEQIQTHQMVPVPPKIEAKNLKDYAQLDLRFELSKLTHQVSTFTEGVLVMEKTLLGIIQVEPRAILEEGLRRELVRQIAKAMHETVIFQDGSHLEIASKLSQLASNLDGLKRSVEYLQDYIGIAGLKMFHEEIVRVIGFNTEQESNRFLKRKISDESSHYQSRAIPIPKFAISASVHTASSSSSSSSKAAASAGLLNGSDSVNFMGRIVNSLVSLTNISNTVYAPQSSAWYKNEKFRKKKKKDMKETLLESCDVRTFALLERSLGAAGLRSLDRLFAFRVASELTNFLKFYDAEVLQHSSFLDEMRDSLFPEHRIVASTSKLYSSGIIHLNKLMSSMVDCLCRIGQGQLIRKQIAQSLQFGCQSNAHMLFHSLETFNTALVNDVINHYEHPDTHPYPHPSTANPLLSGTVALLEASGFDDPLQKIYITSQPLDGLPVLLLFFLLATLPKLEYDSELGTLIKADKKSEECIDGAPLVTGLTCLLKQMHPSATAKLLSYLGQYVRAQIQQTYGESDASDGEKAKAPDMPSMVIKMMLFLEQLCRLSSIPRSAVHAYVPAYIFDSIALPKVPH